MADILNSVSEKRVSLANILSSASVNEGCLENILNSVIEAGSDMVNSFFIEKWEPS